MNQSTDCDWAPKPNNIVKADILWIELIEFSFSTVERSQRYWVERPELEEGGYWRHTKKKYPQTTYIMSLRVFCKEKLSNMWLRSIVQIGSFLFMVTLVSSEYCTVQNTNITPEGNMQIPKSAEHMILVANTYPA